VAEDGDDSNSGADEASALGTVQAALEIIQAAYAGDWPGKGEANEQSAAIIISGEIIADTGDEWHNMIVIEGVAAYPPIVLRGLTSQEGSGIINAARKSGVLDVADGNRVTLDAGLTLTGGSTAPMERLGAGVRVSGSGTTFEMRGGTICNNDSTSGWGGGVLVTNEATFTMSGGTISGNSGGEYGGGGVAVDGDGIFTMSEGTISGNTLSGGDAGGGGGVLLCYSGIFRMSGGTISDNSRISYGANYQGGGGVYVDGDSTFNKWPAVLGGSSGIIYGYDPGDLVNSNKVIDYGEAIWADKGHAVFVGYTGSKKRETTIGLMEELDTTQDGAAGGWAE
jgi:hypothetical protein